VYQTSGTDPNLPSSNPPVYLHVMFGGAPRANPTQAAWLNTLSAFFGLSDAADSSANSTATQPILDFPDDSWHTVRVIANYSSSATQFDILPQQYTVSIDGGTPTTGTFSTPQTTVQSILIGFGGANEQFHYIDDVQVQQPPAVPPRPELSDPALGPVWTAVHEALQSPARHAQRRTREGRGNSIPRRPRERPRRHLPL